MKNLKKKMSKGKEIFWLNEKLMRNSANKTLPFTSKDIDEAEARLLRFAPYISEAFPETQSTGGIIESPLVKIPHMGSALGLDGKLFLKQDSELPISGSVKARGGIYEVLKFAEKIAFENNMLKEDDDYSILLNDEFKELFSKYTVSVGSTGNLGLSIGIMGVQLGFSVKVYMSSRRRRARPR